MAEGNIVGLRRPPTDGVEDPLTELVRNGARKLIEQALEAELLSQHAGRRDEHGRAAALQAIWMAETREQAEKAFDRFTVTYAAKYPKATECLRKDRDALLAFYDFPAEHWVHLRTTNQIESTFATILHRSDRAKGCVSRDSILAFVFKLGLAAETRWRRIRGFEQLAKIIEGVKFTDGVETENSDRAAARLMTLPGGGLCHSSHSL